MRRPDIEALTVAMALAPGVYSRNRHHDLYTDPGVRRARARAAVLRGLVRQLGGAEGPLEGMALDRTSSGAELRYRLTRVGLERRSRLTRIEAACVAYLAERKGIASFDLPPGDRAELFAALRRLAATGDDTDELASLSAAAARASWPPPSHDLHSEE
jgi:hypothetical protein